ncbi:hypothetical protein Phum_PHUM064890 [Pediculus humanus corporis]|uniref:Uncharacterized protein n=1 Tax=Pediculus humanus subsp. corporis TaxID=121224 RepID=E0VBL8_PEDHC|nr:uncharacterized protein Phum_PHUM064890 [Pediculus humanus corporis]EEB10774.1 hypothetical protein Phum_PHUM064890 [Pediculus humanus corporis]
MEGSNSWTLFRTMSFISSRAKAFKERFSHRQRSLSDSWMDQTSLDYTHIDDPSGQPVFEVGGSMQSLLDDNIQWGPAIVVQRSKSLESVSTHHRPSITTIYSPAVPLQCTQSSVSIAVALNSRRSSTIMQRLPLPKPKEQLNVPSSCEIIPQFFSTPLLQSPMTGDADTDLLMAGGSDTNPVCDDVQINVANSTTLPPKQKTSKIHYPPMTPILSRSRPCVPKSIHSTSCTQISDSQIPRIPGPPPTPKKLRPVSACSLDPGAFEVPSLLDFTSNVVEPIEGTKPLIDMSSPPQRRKSRPFSCASFDPLIGFDAPTIQVQQTSSIPNLTNDAYNYPAKIPKIKAPPSFPKNTKTSEINRSLNPFTAETTNGVDINIQSTSIPNVNKTSDNTSKPNDTSSSNSNFLISFEKTASSPSSTTTTTQVPLTVDVTEESDDILKNVISRVPYRKKMSISSSNLNLSLDFRKSPAPFDPQEWKKYVEATFPSIQETGECRRCRARGSDSSILLPTIKSLVEGGRKEKRGLMKNVDLRM